MRDIRLIYQHTDAGKRLSYEDADVFLQAVRDILKEPTAAGGEG